jgi:hypothetical protein
VPEIDWGVMHPRDAERRALDTLAEAFEGRMLPLPKLAAELRERARSVPAPLRPRPNERRIVLTLFGVLRRARAPLSRRGLRDAGARGDGQRLPVIHTAGGPTDEFCPPEAGWRIRSHRRPLPGGRVDRFQTAGEPWMLEPDIAHLAELEARVLAAAQGVDLDACADIAILREHGVPGRDAALHAASDAYVPLHAACAGHRRRARGAVLEPAGLAAWLAARPAELVA